MRRLLAFIVALVTLAITGALTLGPVLGQIANAPTAIPQSASVVAQGVAKLPTNELAWRITRAVTPPPSAQQARTLPGFLLADQGDLLVTNTRGNGKQRLAAGEAAFAPPGAQLQETSLSGAELSYYRIDLVPAAEAANPGSDEMVFVGKPFASPGGERDIDLARAVLDQDEVVELALSAQPAPTLLLVTSGAVGLVPASNPSAAPVQLPAGQAAALGGDVIATASGGPATIILAVIGPEATATAAQQASPTPTATPVPQVGSLTVLAFACPAGYEGDQYGTDCAEPLADIGFSIAGANTGAAFDGATGPDGAAYFGDLPADSYSVSGGTPGEFATQAIACDAASSALEGEATGAAVTLDAGTNATCTFYVVPENLQGEGEGTVTVTVHYCAGTPTDPYAECTAGDPSGVVLGGPTSLTLDSTGSGALPYGTYTVDPSGVAAPDGFTVAEVRGAGDGASFAIDEANPEASLAVILVPATGEEGEGGEGNNRNNNRRNNVDSDEDGLTDNQEAGLGLDPANPDMDSDGLLDGQEVAAGTDPMTANLETTGETAVDTDSDGDGFTDAQETVSGSDPADPASIPETAGPVVDSDGDGLLDSQEAELGTDPATTDTDGDGLSDTAEAGLAFGRSTGSDPTLWDSDGDGVGDGDEIFAGTDPADPAS